MKCPYCGEEMERGFIQTGGNSWKIFWNKNMRGVMGLSHDYTFKNSLLHPEIETFRCEKCKKFIIRYDED